MLLINILPFLLLIFMMVVWLFEEPSIIKCSHLCPKVYISKHFYIKLPYLLVDNFLDVRHTVKITKKLSFIHIKGPGIKSFKCWNIWNICWCCFVCFWICLRNKILEWVRNILYVIESRHLIRSKLKLDYESRTVWFQRLTLYSNQKVKLFKCDQISCTL